MANNTAARNQIGITQYEADVFAIMASRHPREHQLMLSFSSSSEGFVKLRARVLKHYITRQPQLSPLFAVDALAKLVNQVLANMQVDLRAAA